MFYEMGQCGAPAGLLNSCDAPRSIFWISTVSQGGAVNLAPYSFSSAIAYKPPQVMFAVTGLRKDGGEAHTLVNARETGEFVVNFVPYEFREQMNLTSAPAPADVDEMKLAKLQPVASNVVKPPGVKVSPIRLECRVARIVELLGSHNTMVVGEVVGIHIDDRIIHDGQVRWTAYKPVARLGRSDGYTHVTEEWFMNRPSAEMG
jgi:flavin reductase (DIM6/NTAB) family NADH-FMN oxidoreductase RutF